MATNRRREHGPVPDAGPGQDVLTMHDLTVTFGSGRARTEALREVNLTVRSGEILGIAGESGSGKTTAALAAMGLLARGAEVRGSIRYRGTELLTLSERQVRRHRGRDLAMIFQETASALNPVIRVGDQLMMAARAHFPDSRARVRSRVVAALADVRLHDADRVMASYPHELSGGMCQRIIIAMALSCGSHVLFADEPTTALDVSVQHDILELIRGLVTKRNLAVMLISHDLAVLSEVCDNLAVMYRGRIVETGAAADILNDAWHPYTKALLGCVPSLHGEQGDLQEITDAQRVAIEAAEPLIRPAAPIANAVPAPRDQDRRTRC